MASIQIILSLVKLFIMIIPGYILAKTKVLDEAQSKGISSIIINLTWPCLIVMSLQRDFSVQLCINMGILAIVMTISIIFAFAISIILCKGFRMEKSKAYLMIFMLMFGNTGFMGIPVCTALYGSEGSFYAALVDAVQDVFILTLGLILVERSTGSHIGLSVKHFLTPAFASIVIGLALFVLRITLPAVIATPLETMGEATSPLAMIVVGYQLGNLKFGDIITDKRMYAVSGFRLVFMPALFFLGITALIPEMTLLYKVIVVEIATPVAACTTIFSQQYDGDVGFATKGVMLSTVLSLITLSAFSVIVEL